MYTRALFVCLFVGFVVGSVGITCAPSGSQEEPHAEKSAETTARDATPEGPGSPDETKPPQGDSPPEKDSPPQVSTTSYLASFYGLHMAICDGVAYEWSGNETPKKAMEGVVQVGVGSVRRYALTKDGSLYTWRDDVQKAQRLMKDVRTFASGQSGVFAIQQGGSLWQLQADTTTPKKIADGVKAASIGDGTNYYVTTSGDLFAKGAAHRGQYGNGSLESTDTFVKVAANVTQVKGHTGHALHLKVDGGVYGTGGNIFGPLGKHGIGDKAVTWGLIFEGARAFATGSSHSVAIKADDSLWIWGRDEGLTPKKVMDNVRDAEAGSTATIALKKDGTLWQWDRGKSPQKIFTCP